MNVPAALAVVVPFFNEEDNIEPVCVELKSALEGASIKAEVILVDDGSTDTTGKNLDRIARRWPQCRVFHFAENRGQSAALLFGLKKARAPILATMDGDGQSDPGDLARLLTRLDKADMVVGWRVERQDSWARRKISCLANLIRAEWLGDGVSDAGCALKVFRREVADAFIPIRTLYSFMPALAVAAGFRVVQEPVNHRLRAHGTSRYSLRSFLLLPIIDFIGLRWFRSRRCPGRATRLSADYRDSQSLDELYRRSLSRWLKWVSLTVAAVLLATIYFLYSSAPRGGPQSRKIGLSRAERIALHQVPKGDLRAEELRMEAGRLAWLIDVQPRGSIMIDEIEIDATDGRVLATHLESPEEEQLELAVEDRQITPRPLVPR